MNQKRANRWALPLLVMLVVSFFWNAPSASEQNFVAPNQVYTEVVSTAHVVEVTATQIPTKTLTPAQTQTPVPTTIETQVSSSQPAVVENSIPLNWLDWICASLIIIVLLLSPRWFPILLGLAAYIGGSRL